MKNHIFELDIHRMTGGIERLERIGGKDFFNWTRGKFGIPYGLNFLDKTEKIGNTINQKFCYFSYLDVYVKRELTEEGLRESYIFKNCGKKPISVEKGELGIYATFADSLDIEDTLIRRARSHVWCGQNSSYIYNARLDGSLDGVGLVLLQGCLDSYEEEDGNKHNRGDIVLKLPALTLLPEQTYEIEWLIFPYNSKDDFLRVLDANILVPLVSNYYPQKGEEIIIRAKADKAILNGKEYDFAENIVKLIMEYEGEQLITLKYGDRQTSVYVYSGKLNIDLKNLLGKDIEKKSSKNAERALFSARENIELYRKIKDEGYLALAAVDMFRYYNKFKGEKRTDMCIPIVPLSQIPGLTERFKNQVAGALSYKGKYSLTRELAATDMLLAAYSIWQEEGYLFLIKKRLLRLKNWIGIQPHYKLNNQIYINGETDNSIDCINAFAVSGRDESLREYLIKSR